jgi:ketosteroid isomerase-like protein
MNGGHDMRDTAMDVSNKNLANEILGLEARRIAAMVSRDLDVLDALLADDLSYTHSSGTTDTKANFLELIRAKEARHNDLGVDFSDTDVIAIPGGHAVVVRGRAQIRLEGIPSYQVLFLDVWALRDGAWKMVAWQATRIP